LIPKEIPYDLVMGCPKLIFWKSPGTVKLLSWVIISVSEPKLRHSPSIRIPGVPIKIRGAIVWAYYHDYGVTIRVDNWRAQEAGTGGVAVLAVMFPSAMR